MEARGGLRVPKTAVNVELSLDGGAPRAVALFVAEHLSSGARRQRVIDLLISPDGFLPVREVADDSWSLVNKTLITWVSVPLDGADGDGDDELFDIRKPIAAELVGGSRMLGELFYSAPQGRARVADFLNDAQRFFRLWSTSSLYLLNKRYVARILELYPMARIDTYLKSIERFSASGIVLKSNAHVLLKFPAGDRYATQTVTHEILQELVRGVVPSGMRLGLDTGTQIEFPYALDGQRYRVQVQPGGAEWTVAVEVDRAEAPPPKGGGGGGEIEIERHSYAAQAASPSTVRPTAGASATARPSAPASPTARPSGGLPLPDFGPAAAPASAPGPSAALAATMAAPVAAASPSAPITLPPAAPIPLPQPAAPVAVSASAPAGGRWIDRILKYLREQGGSDLHLTSGSPPYVRVDGEIVPLEKEAKLDPDWLLEQLMEIAHPDNQAEFKERNDTDFAYNVPGLARFRVNVFRDRNGPGAVLRTIPFKIPSAADLGLSSHILDLTYLTKGLVVVTGPTGSGKSTTLAAMIDHLNRTRRTHIITIEDPIEFVHENKLCLINQREIRTHTRSFKDALRAALREDPDVVLVGEMRDLETIAIAVETAETGHLVFGTLHTTTAPSTVDRIIDQFPADRQEQIRTMLAKSLKGVIAQVLCKKKGGGRVAAQEILMGSSAVENLIREGKTFQLGSLMQTGRNIGMQTMNDCLFDLVKAGTIEPMEAYVKSVAKAEIKGQLQRAGFEV